MDEIYKKLDTVEALMVLDYDEVEANFFLALEHSEATGDVDSSGSE